MIKLEIIEKGIEKKYDYESYLNASTPLQFSADIEQLDVQFGVLNPLVDDVSYRFRLNGQKNNTEWTRLPIPELILYQFPYGHHRLELAVYDDLNKIIVGQTQLDFEVAWPWYLTTWAIVGFIILLVVFVRMAIRFTFYRLEQKNLMLENIVKQRTEQIKEDKLIIEQQNLELNRLNTAKDKLFAIIGHELRAPLMGVMGMSKKAAYLLKNEQWNSLDKISKQLDRYAADTQTMLQNLLNWGQVMVHESEPDTERIAVKEVTDHLIKTASELLDKKQIKLANKIPSNAHILFDEEGLKIILRNLLHNAIKFSPFNANIIVALDKTPEGKTQISVSDQGKGMSKEVLENWNNNLFVHSSTGTDGEKGTGLGLKISKELAQKNNSRLFFELLDAGGTRAVLET